MSKSLGNGIDPLEMADRYGADALRMNLLSGVSPGNDMRFYVERCEAMRNFSNKLWNASRFVLMNLTVSDCALPETLEAEDKWILSKLNDLVAEVTDNLERYELGVAASKLYDFIWSRYCDWYIELTKSRLQSGDEAASAQAQRVLGRVLTETLKLLHPFMPFVTEEIWQALPHEGDFLMLQSWPKYEPALSFQEEAADMERVMDAIRAVRNRRAELNVPPSKKAALTIVSQQPEAYRAGEAFIARLAYASRVTVSEETPADTKGLVSAVTHDARLYLPLAELVDIGAEKARIQKERAKTMAELEKLENKLKNPGFAQKAPASVVAAETERAEKLRSLLLKLDESEAELD
jgi:valyl-tRNA synthetase